MMEMNVATREIIRYALEHAPSLEHYCKEHLQHLAGTDQPFGRAFYNLEFKRDALRCNAYLKLNEVDRRVDEAGDTHCTYKAIVEVSWPSYGSQLPEVAKEFVELLKECLTFAEGFKAHFSEPIVELVETKAQREQRQLEARRSQTKNLVTDLVRANCKGMRVGQERALTASADLEPLGSVQLTMLGKDYTAHIGSMRTFYFMRTA